MEYSILNDLGLAYAELSDLSDNHSTNYIMMKYVGPNLYSKIKSYLLKVCEEKPADTDVDFCELNLYH